MLPICQRGGKCPCSYIVDSEGNKTDVENLALDEELSEQIDLLQITLSVHETTQDPEALRATFKQFGIYEDILSHFEIIKTWNQYRASQKPKSAN